MEELLYKDELEMYNKYLKGEIILRYSKYLYIFKYKENFYQCYENETEIITDIKIVKRNFLKYIDELYIYSEINLIDYMKNLENKTIIFKDDIFYYQNDNNILNKNDKIKILLEEFLRYIIYNIHNF